MTDTNTKTDIDRNIIVRVTENLGRLKRNEDQMTPEQKAMYGKAVKKLRNRIWSDALAIMQQFLFLGCRMTDSEADKEILHSKVTEIMQNGGTESIEEAAKVLFSTYDLNAFLKALIPLNKRIYYEAYSEVWLFHCRKTGKTYRNDLIDDLEWNADYGMWFNMDKKTFGCFLPPTKELLDAAC